MTQELQEIRTLAREFATAELRPHTEAWDAAAGLDSEVRGKVAELGFFGMLVPEADGGMGFDAGTWAAALEELAWGEPAVALLLMHSVLAGDYIARFGSDELKEQWLGRLAAGEDTAAIAFAEDADGGVSAAQEDGGWRIRGRKRWVAGGDSAAMLLVSAATSDGAAVFAVPAGSGVDVAGRHATLGFRPLPLVDIELDVVVPVAARLDGAAEAATDDVLGRLSTAALAVGIAQAALDHAVRYGGEREQFGRPIREFEGIQRKLADMAIRITAARALVQQAAAAPDDGARAAMAKVDASECAMFVTTEAVQIFGGYGYMRDYPVEKLMRDAKATEIMHGPNEMLRVRIAESLHS
ncbi:MAG TPA: acyl-CoA dehydrogenase family protein [Longimicrobiales bacterium]|nr:acyl-CoA dehydrogenase family protein [Longimicrobiales bacterium]